MEQTTIKQKLNTLEAEVRMLRLALRRPINFAVDDLNWQQLKSTSKRGRQKLFKKRYG